MLTATQLLQPTKNKMQRPDFDEIKTFEEFSKYYWYRDELIKICKSHGLMAPSGKIELNKVIESYFRGEILEPKKKLSEIRQKQSAKKKPSQKKIISELSLQTGIIECGFTFGPKFRAFFEEATGVKIPYVIKDRRAGDIATCYADSTKAQQELGWTPQHTLADMCKDAWHWQKLNPNGYEE